MALSLICEPGDPRLPRLLSTIGPTKLLTAIRAGRPLPDQRCPDAWRHAASDVDEQLRRVEGLAQAAGLRWLTPGDASWPQQLSDLDHLDPEHGSTGAPLGLWIRGERRLSDLLDMSVAIVGARDCTSYGAQVSAEIAADISSAGVTVVSGAAYGIDASAHRGAMSALRPTIAVLACDAATDYPRAHGPMLNRIAAEGLVVSEQPPGQMPTKSRFLSRNRLIAAFAQGTLIVEARRRSGALNTLGWADRLGRATMAVPGPVTSPQSAGPHLAVREGRAVLVSSAAEVVDELAGLGAVPSSSGEEQDATAWDQLPPEVARVLDAVDWTQGLGLDEIARRARVGQEVARRALLALTEAGWVTVCGPASWVLARRADLVPTTGPRTVGE